MSYPHGCCRKAPGLRVRPIPELDACLVYMRQPPQLCRLNLSAWLILELCDGKDAAALHAAYVDAIGDNGEAARALFDAGLGELVDLGIVQVA